MSKFILLHSVEEREGVEIVQPRVINVDHIVLIETDWNDCDLKLSCRVDGHPQTKVYVTQSHWRWVSVRESVSEIMSMIGSESGGETPSMENLSNATQQFVASNTIADDKWWDREFRDSYGDGRGGEE